MPKLLALFSILVVGAGVALGGLAMGGNKSESQITHELTATVFREEEVSDDIVVVEEGDSSTMFDEKVLDSKALEEHQKDGVDVEVSPSPKGWEDQCLFYSVQTSKPRKAKKVDYDFVDKHVTNVVEKQEVQEACKQKQKVYVANLKKVRGVGGWGYRPEDQEGEWAIIT